MTLTRPLVHLVFGLALALLTVSFSIAQTPQPGELYREFALHNGGDRDWRVTDSQAVIKFEQARDHLPNSKLTLPIDDLEHAVRAEVLLDRWGGHRGTINKRIRFNESKWVRIPEIDATPAGIRPEMLMFQDNPVVNIPLGDLSEGDNLIEADCDEAGGFGWGQWGLYSLVVRVYYDPRKKGDDFAIEGRITSPASNQTIQEYPEITLVANAAMGVARVDVLAAYDGFDEDGDGDFNGWHESHFQLVRGEANEIRDHAGTLWKEPYRLVWDTKWIPDQEPASISLIARVQDSRGYWSVSQPIDGLSLKRDGFTVNLYKPIDVPEDFAVRVGETKQCFFEIPASDPLGPATESRLHLRTWHGWDGHHEPLQINEFKLKVAGKNHFYDYDVLQFPAAALRHGKNTFSIHSNTEHHMLEVLWPGPAIVTRTPLEEKGSETRQQADVSIDEAEYLGRPHFVVTTEQATYWLDRKSGGLSRLIDRDQLDWINFKLKPWDEYPAASASSFRGMPNLVFNGDDKGFGHPGWDQARSRIDSRNSIVSESNSGKWRLRWDFTAKDARCTVEKSDPEVPYWFLYEGPLAGKWNPKQQLFATDQTEITSVPRDYFKGNQLYAQWRWACFGDQGCPRYLGLVHEQQDEHVDTFSHLGNSERGLDSKDGMVVFGFGRGPNGIEPLLTGTNSFRIRFIESDGKQKLKYPAIKLLLDPQAP